MTPQTHKNLTKGKTCIVIAGPTAVGKTAFAIKLAQHFGTQIISADSRQCFTQLNIGVAKPSVQELQSVPHYFINSHSINTDVNAVVFEQYALQKANDIFTKNDVAILVGGTGLYIKAFCDGIDALPDIDPAIRENIIANFEKNGLQWLQQQVAKNDPIYFTNGEIKNPHRLIRVLEVKLSTGNSITTYQTNQKKQRPFAIKKIGLQLPKEILHQNINQRVDVMMQQGLLQEVESLLAFKTHNALQTVGYKELFEYFDNKLSLQEAIERIKINTRQYAKRQITWFKKDEAINWVSPLLPVTELLEDILLEK
jgi:tRNA dimethylallyltransferase